MNRYLKIVSINVNNFGNLEIKPIWPGSNAPQTAKSEYKKMKSIWISEKKVNDRIVLAKCIAKWIICNQIDIVLLNEYDVSEYDIDGETIKISDEFVKELNAFYKTDVSECYPKDMNGNIYNDNYGSICTCFVSKRITDVEVCNAPNITHKFNGESWTWARWINIKLKIEEEIYRIIGVHIPYGDNKRSKKYWDILIDFCEKNIGSKVIIMGDMNAYTSDDIAFDKPASENEEELKKLNSCIRDVYRAFHPYTPCYSYINNNIPRRLDYIFATNKIIETVKEVKYLHNINSIFNPHYGFTDHSGLLLTIFYETTSTG